MKKYMVLLFVAALLVLGFFLAFSWYDKPRRTTQRFIGNLYHERYEDAALMLHPPSTLEMHDDALVILDKDGRSTSVPGVQLPFMASDANGMTEHDFAVTALGPSTNGILHHPAVTIYLRLVGNEVAIEMVEQ